jgi:tryptophan 2,3-dioxygenase
MSTAEGPLRKPSLADTFGDIDRRMRTLEYGDPNAVADARRKLADISAELDAINAQITTLDNAIANLSGQLGVVHDSSISRDNVLHANDGNIYTWLTQYAPPERTWQNVNLANYIVQRADWAVAYHMQYQHTIGTAGPTPGWTNPPVLPAWPIITDPTP